MTFAALALLHLVPTLLMTGVIWFVQVVHYPLFRRVGAQAFSAYEAENVTRTTWVVLPTMLAELGLTIWLCLAAPGVATTTGLLLLAFIWLTTFVEQVPCHARLQVRANDIDMLRLVRGNWLRTIAWTARSALALALVWPA